MKSHVKENQFKSLISTGMRQTETENGFDVEFSQMFNDIIAYQYEGATFKNWFRSNDNKWSVDVYKTVSGNSNKYHATGNSINDCINNAKAYFGDDKK